MVAPTASIHRRTILKGLGLSGAALSRAILRASLLGQVLSSCRCFVAPAPELDRCGCQDAAQAGALDAYTQAISSPRFLERVPVGSQGRPQLIPGHPLIGQFLEDGNSDIYHAGTYTNLCGDEYNLPGAHTVHRMRQHECLTGRKVAAVKAFAFYSWNGLDRSGVDLGIPRDYLNAIQNEGAIPFLADSPSDCGDPAKAILYLMSDIVSGRWDDKIRQRGRELRDLGYYLFYSWGHEMNGNWYSYGRADLGNAPEIFAAAMRRVYNLYQEEGATNLLWVYSPHVWNPIACGISDNPTECPIESVDRYYPYPGRGEADFIFVIAPHLYNWGNATYAWGRATSLSFDQLARDTFTILGERHPEKLFGIGEMGTSAVGVDMPAWIRDAYSKMLKDPYNVSLVVYFNPPQDDVQNPPRWPFQSNLF